METPLICGICSVGDREFAIGAEQCAVRVGSDGVAGHYRDEQIPDEDFAGFGCSSKRV
jgi:hypothetical protein